MRERKKTYTQRETDNNVWDWVGKREKSPLFLFDDDPGHGNEMMMLLFPWLHRTLKYTERGLGDNW